MNIAESIINLFLSVFRCLLRYLNKKYPGFSKFYLIIIENQAFHRYFEQRGIKPPFLPHERQIVHECYKTTGNPSRLFSIISPKTILTIWNNAIARHWTYKHKNKRKPGRPPLAKAIKELIIKMKQDNFTWGCWRIMGELRKLSINVSQETIRKINNLALKGRGMLVPRGMDCMRV